MVIHTKEITLHLDDDNDETYGWAGSQKAAAQIARAIIGDSTTESMMVIHLNSRQQVLGYTEVVRGSVNRQHMTAREVFAAAVMLNSASIVLAHNHPSGDLSPSNEDKVVTERLIEDATILGIPVRDHIIVTRRNVYSMADANGGEL